MTDANRELQPVAKRKPPSAGRGRKKGELNKLTRTIKEAIEEAFEKAGGADYLAKMAVQEPVAFMSLLAKVLPAQINASLNTTEKRTVVINFAAPPEC